MIIHSIIEFTEYLFEMKYSIECYLIFMTALSDAYFEVYSVDNTEPQRGPRPYS